MRDFQEHLFYCCFVGRLFARLEERLDRINKTEDYTQVPNKRLPFLNFRSFNPGMVVKTHKHINFGLLFLLYRVWLPTIRENQITHGCFRILVGLEWWFVICKIQNRFFKTNNLNLFTNKRFKNLNQFDKWKYVNCIKWSSCCSYLHKLNFKLAVFVN